MNLHFQFATITQQQRLSFTRKRESLRVKAPAGKTSCQILLAQFLTTSNNTIPLACRSHLLWLLIKGFWCGNLSTLPLHFPVVVVVVVLP
jgi:hypothetical protein